MTDDRDFKGVWIPKEIWLNSELTALDKCIYAEISSLDNSNHCTAGNVYFAKFCGCSESKVSKSIKKLQDMGLIEVISFDGRHRTIKITKAESEKMLGRLVKNARQTSKKCQAESEKMPAINIYNNTNNNTDNNISISKDIDMDIVENIKKSSNNDIKDTCIKDFIDMYHNICISLPKVRTITDKRKKAIMKIVHKYSNEDIEECLRLAESSGFLTGKNDRGWKADIDFILREDKFVSILEGKYKTKYKRNNAITDMDIRSNTMSKDDLKEFKEAIKNGELQRF